MPKINDLKHYPEKDNQPITRPWSRRELLTLFAAASAGILGIRLPGLSALAQTMGIPGGPPPGAGPGGNNSSALAEAFKGITTDGTVIPDLFPVYRTGVSSGPILTAAQVFLSSLNQSQQASALFALEDDEWRKWNNVDMYRRQGVCLSDMTDSQKKAAFGLLGAALSAKGLELSQNIMRLNTTEGELLNQLGRFNENLYWFTVMGTPHETEPWGFQLDGHHLIINYFILGDQVVMSPVFFGSEPPVATSGRYKGISVLQREQDYGLAMINALSDEQRSRAIVRTGKTGNNLVAGAFQDNLIIDYMGIKASLLASTQQEQLMDLIALWVNNIRDEHALIRMNEVKAHMAETCFGWVGGIDSNAIFYYRIQSPVILIEFDHELPGPLGQVLPSGVPTRNHIHAIMRTPNGNDYGKALLRRHLLTHPHHTAA